MLFFLVSKHKLNWLNIKPLTFLGTISYSLYLVHQNIGYIVINKLSSFNMPIFFTTMVAIIVVSILAIIITFYIEKPSMNYLKNLLKK